MAYVRDGHLETNELQDVEVARKDERMKQWRQDVSQITGQQWQYLKVLEEDFNRYQFRDFESLARS